MVMQATRFDDATPLSNVYLPRDLDSVATDELNDGGTDGDETHPLIEPRAVSRRVLLFDEDTPLVDTTETLKLKSKKIERQQKKLQKKLRRTTARSDTKNFLELPPELLEEVLGYLRPGDLVRLLRLNKSTQEFVRENEIPITRNIIRRRYWVLSQTFPQPVPLQDVEPMARECLLTPNWQERLRIHKGPYSQFISPHEPETVCSCMTCVLAWNNLNLILDLAHFQKHRSEGQPIPIIPRGTSPEWNRELLARNAALVRKATAEPIYHACILQTHLSTLVSILTRHYRVGKPTLQPSSRLYDLSAADVAAETDAFLERRGPESFEFPVYRDKYHHLEAYVPNRRWDRRERRWIYFSASKMHENDVSFVRSHSTFAPVERSSRRVGG